MFHEKYNALFSSKLGKTKDLDAEKFNYILQVKLNYRKMTGNERVKSVRNFINCYELRGNVRNHCLVNKQRGKFLSCAIVENFFDIINDINVNKLGHARSPIEVERDTMSSN